MHDAGVARGSLDLGPGGAGRGADDCVAALVDHRADETPHIPQGEKEAAPHTDDPGVLEGGRALDPRAVDEGAVAALLVGHRPFRAVEGHVRVAARDPLVVERLAGKGSAAELEAGGEEGSGAEDGRRVGMHEEEPGQGLARAARGDVRFLADRLGGTLRAWATHGPRIARSDG